MHRNIQIKNIELFNKIKEISNPSKFKIIELIQKEKLSITILSKKVNLAFNKCSNYCTQLQKKSLLIKEKKGKNVFVKTNINLERLKKFI